MRRAITAVLAAAGLVAGFAALPAPAFAGDRGDGYYDRGCDCYRSQRGYWERPGEGRRNWNRHNHRRYRDRGVHYYPGYGYYPDRGGHHGDRYGQHGGSSRSEWCARRYRSYDYRTGNYVTYDGRVRYCG